MGLLSVTTVRFGNVPISRVLRPSGTLGDWIQHVAVSFGPPIPAPTGGVPAKDVAQRISVILTPHSAVPVVPVVESVSTTGFVFSLRNADPTQDAGSITVDWLAVLGVPDVAPSPIDARLSVLQHQHFSGFLDNQPQWPRIWFSTRMVTTVAPVVLLTANNLNVPSNENPAVIGTSGVLANSADLVAKGVIVPGFAFGMSVRATDVDTVGGNTGFYAAAFTLNSSAPARSVPSASAAALVLDNGTEENTDNLALYASGLLGPRFPVSPGGVSGDWVSADIYFSSPFSTPPLVLATARGQAPVVPIARNVTTHGFTMALRNTDTVAGKAAFFWVAIGCAAGCG
jgi:hypothetical protein